MNVPKFNDREKAFEEEYIRRKEAEKFKPAQTSTQPGSTGSSGTQSGNSAAQNAEVKK